MPELSEWDSFYVIVGSAAGGLIGLQFVVMTLIADRPRPNASEAGAAFSTPTIVHFGTVLLLAALLRAPWHAVSSAATVWGFVGLIGVLYVANVTWHMRRQKAYKPAMEDWICHSLLPVIAYVVLGASALAAMSHLHEALFGAGVAALMLLFIGIHNAWDAIMFHVFDDRR